MESKRVDCVNEGAPAGTFRELIIREAWPCVTEVGIFSLRPWWQRVVSLVYRPWRRSDRLLASSVVYRGELVTPLHLEEGQTIVTKMTFSACHRAVELTLTPPAQSKER